MRNYATTIGIDTSRVLCVASGSEKYLPTLTSEQFDVIFIDGMVGFPWPILDGTTLTIISKSAAW